MRQLIIALTLCLGVVDAQPVDAGSYGNGHVINGFTFNNGYWWRGNVAFNRVQQQYRYYDGCRHCIGTRYVFQQAQVQKQKYPDEGFDVQQELLKLAGQKAKWDYELRQSEQQQKQFLEGLRALNLDGGYHPQTGYPSNLTGQAQLNRNPHSLYGVQQSYTAPLAQQGRTVFGYDSIATVYPDVDLKVLYNQANNLASGAQGLAQQSTGDFMALVAQSEAGRVEVAKIMARGQAAAQVLEMLRDPATGTHTTTEFMLRRGEDGCWQVRPRQPSDPPGEDPPQWAPPPNDDRTDFTPDGVFGQEDRLALFEVIQNKCIDCHGGRQTVDGLDMSKYLSFSPEKQQGIIDRLTTGDPNRRMPRSAGGGPGKALSLDEVALFIRAAGLQPADD